MGTALSKGAARRYPTGATRAAENLLHRSAPQSGPATFAQQLENQRVPPHPAIRPESLENVIKPAEQSYTETRKARLNDPALGLEEFDIPAGQVEVGQYSEHLNDMLKRLGPVNIQGGVTESNNITSNPVALMFQVRRAVSERGQLEQSDHKQRRTLFSSAELVEIIELGKRGWTRKELEDHFYLDPRVLDELGSAFRKYKEEEKPVVKPDTKEDDSFNLLMRHGEGRA